MELDELLARQLQHVELAEGRSALSAEEQEKGRLLHSIETSLDLCSKCEHEELQALALSLIPLDELLDIAARTKQLNQEDGTSGSVLDVPDYLAQELMQWFKKSFFQWVNAPACEFCGGKTEAAGIEQPSSEERAYQASRTEVYRCSACGAITRFPRYSDVRKLLETRKGRCGEYANAALLCCRAVGLTARYIWDSEDHVWTEYWSNALQRWVHLDFCEAAFDKPLLYEGGWKKMLKYVLAICPTSVTDVTPRYTCQPSEVSRRRVVPDSWLHAQVSKATRELRASLPASILQVLELQDVSEQLELLDRANANEGPLTPEQALAQGLTGRQTGDVEWQRARGEDGLSCTSGTGAPSLPAKPQAATLWRPLPSRQLHDEYVDMHAGEGSPGSVCARAGRLLGGACRASAENSGEGALHAFDGMVHTKWLDYGGGGPNGCAWLEFRLMGSAPACSPLLSYDLVSANDSPERDPRDWVVEGLRLQDEQAGNFGDEAWEKLDTQQGVTFTGRHQLHSFTCQPLNTMHVASTEPAAPSSGSSSATPLTSSKPSAMTAPGQPPSQRYWRRFRLRITATADPPAANSVQLAAWNLYGPQRPAPLGEAPSSNSRLAQGSSSGKAFDGLQACVFAAQQVVEAKAACLLDAQQVEVLHRVASNVAEHPEDVRFRRLRASKTLSLASSPEALRLLLAMGFRPLVSPQPQPKTVPALFFVLESGALAVDRAKNAARILAAAI